MGIQHSIDTLAHDMESGNWEQVHFAVEIIMNYDGLHQRSI